MNYKVVPFIAQITQEGSAGDVAMQLQGLINTQVKQGWEYVRLEQVETSVLGSAGCFGIGAKQGYSTIYRMAIFKQ
jgi:hypothetical protein